jgi:hypothetical protein
MFAPSQIINQRLARLINKYARHGVKPRNFIHPDGDKTLRAVTPSG